MTLDGSIPISEIPNLNYLNLKNNIMFCIQLLTGEDESIAYLSTEGIPTSSIKDIKWWPHFLACEEHRSKHGGKAVIGSDVVIERISTIVSFLEMEIRNKNKIISNLEDNIRCKEERIKVLLDETMNQQKLLNPDLEDYDPKNFNHRTSTIEHAVEQDDDKT